MSPQVMNGDNSMPADLWSIGVITYMLLTDKKPFWGRTPQEIIAAVRKGNVDYSGREWSKISANGKDFVSKLLVMDPALRLTAHEAQKYPFILERLKLSDTVPNPDLMKNVPSNLVRLADGSDFKRIVLNVIANKSSSEEIYELRKVFAQYDDGDGTISMEQFKTALSEFNLAEEEAESIFSRIDVNRTGNILYTEFLAATLEVRGNIELNKIAEAFDQLDADDKGYITKENMRNIIGAHISDSHIEQIIEQVDPDSNGKITFDEFKRALADDTKRKIASVYDKSTNAGIFGVEVPILKDIPYVGAYLGGD